MAKFTFRPMGIYQHREGRFLIREAEDASSNAGNVHGRSETGGSFGWSPYKVLVSHIQIYSPNEYIYAWRYREFLYYMLYVYINIVYFKLLNDVSHLWNWNLNDVRLIMKWSLSLAMFNSKCQKSVLNSWLHPVSGNKSLKNLWNVFR